MSTYRRVISEEQEPDDEMETNDVNINLFRRFFQNIKIDQFEKINKEFDKSWNETKKINKNKK